MNPDELLGRERTARTLREAGSAYAARFAREADHHDLHAAITLLSEAAVRESPGWRAHADLAELLYERFWSGPPFGDALADLDAIIHHYRQARESCDSGQDATGLSALLGIALARRAHRWPRTAEADNDEAERLLSAVYALGADVEYALGCVRVAIGRRPGRRQVLDLGIEHLEHCLHDLPEGDETRQEALLTLADAYRFRKDPRDLDRVARYLRELWESDKDAEVGSALASVLFDVACRPEATRADIEAATEMLDLADGVRHVAQLGLLRLRHGEGEAAMGTLMRALAGGRLDDDLAGQCHTRLGLALLERALSSPGTLDAAIAHLEQGSAPVVLDHARSVRALVAGGFDPVELRAAIDALRRDRSALPPGDPAIPALDGLLGQLLMGITPG